MPWNILVESEYSVPGLELSGGKTAAAPGRTTWAKMKNNANLVNRLARRIFLKPLSIFI